MGTLAVVSIYIVVIGCSIISLFYPFTIFVLVSIAVLVGIAFKLFVKK